MPGRLLHVAPLPLVGSDEAYRRAYRDNLEYVYPYTHEVFKVVTGKTAVTADYGLINYDGVLKYLGLKSHKPDLRLTELVEMPWAVVDDERREVTVDKTKTTMQYNADDRFPNLGYKI